MSSFGIGLTLLPHGAKNYSETSGIHQYVDPAGSKRVNLFFRELESGCGCAGGALQERCHETSQSWLLEPGAGGLQPGPGCSCVLPC